MIYLKDGNIPLNLAYDDDIVQEANSTYQLSFKFPLTDGKWNLLKREVFLLADDLHGEQEFFIFEVKKVNSHVQVYAKQVATLLNYYSINSISVDRVPGQTVMTALAGSVKRPCPFTFFSDILDRHTFNESNVSVMDALAKDKHSVIGQWGGDLVRDKYQVKLLKNGGTENESLFMYKKNLSSYEESENINNLKTRLHLKKIIQGQSEGEEDRVIVVTVDSPLISQYSQIYEADIEVNDQDVTDEASLLAYGQRYFGSTLCDLVENSINLDVKGKSDVSVKMFDTVSVFHERFDVDLRLKITSYHFGPMSKRLKSIGFGKVSQSFGSTVASMVAGSIDKATGRLSASFEQKLQKEIDNANRHFDAEFEKRVEEINDGIEQAQAEAERYADAIKQEIDTEIAQVNQSMQAQSEEHDRQVADILAKTQSVESLANQAKTDAASAIAQALQFENEAIAEATRLDTVERQATETKLATAKSQVISEATRLVETAKSLLSGQIANVSTDLSQTKEAIKLLATKATVDTLTGRVSSAEAMIQVQADQISQRVKTSDFDQAKQRISTAESSITQLGNRITTEISETVAKIPKELGIRNLIKGTKDLSGNNRNQNTSDTYLGFNIARSRPSSGYVDTFRVATTINATATAYVTTFYARSDVDGFLIDCHLFSPNTTTSAESSTGHKTKAIDGLVNVRLTTEWKRYWVKWTQTPVNEIKNLIVGRNRVERGNATVEIAGVALYEGDMPKDWSPAPEDAVTEIENVKTIITQTAEGQQQLSTRLIEAQGKITTAETNIRQLISDVSSKVSQTDYNTLTGRVDSAETAITQNATEISKRLTKTQVDKAITDKGYQTKSDVDSNITGRGYITSSALQPYALAATVQTLVRETADSFSRTISETRALIPTSAGGRNYLLNSKTEISGAWSNKAISLSQELLDNLSKIKTVTISCDVEGANVSAINSRKRYGLACSVEINGVVNYWEVWQTQDTTKKRISQTFSVPEGKVITKFYSPTLWIQAEGSVKVSNPKLEFGVLSTDWTPAPEDLATVTALHAVNDTVDSHTRTIGAVGEAGSILDNVSKVTQTAQGLVQEVSGTNGLKTQVSTLAGSYAIKNLTKAGDVLGQINLNSDGSVRINEGLISVGTKTYIQDGVITSAKIAGLDAGKITSGYLASGRIKAGSIDGSKIAFDEAFFNGLVANQAYLKKLFAKDAFLTAVQAVAVSAKQITGGIAEALNGGMDVNFDESKINFYTNVAAIRRIYTGHPTQFIKFETEGNYSRTIIGSNRNGGEVFNSATFAGIVVENTNNINTEDNVRIYGDNTLLRHAQGDVGWNINSVTQRIVPANMNAESEIWSKHFVAPDKNSKPVRLDTAVAALWDIWNHIIYNNFEFNAALRTHIKARRDNWKFELNL
ncbi:phage tail spike protein [Streptococcus suis]|uniref:phage tail spike protein n=1 Tax=Streptococcus suis TaxID=1307 RepID=UPI002E0D8B65|nr:phage tail spike protein [Streptococcus suis]